MTDTRTRPRRQRAIPGRYRLGAALAALAGLTAAVLFYLAANPRTAPPFTPTHGAAPLPAGKPPAIRFMLGADLWCLVDSSLLDGFGRPYPQYGVDSLGSRSLLDLPVRPYPREILLMLPAEKFIADEFERQRDANPSVVITEGPDVCRTHLALLMSTKTRDALISSRPTPPSTLSDWLEACVATNAQPEPVRFTMADPNTCSASWLGVADLLLDRFPAKERPLADVPVGELAAAVGDLQRQILVRGNSDRVEMYRWLLGGCPDNRVLLVYGHLADLMAATNAFSGYAIVIPQLHFQPVVRAIVVSRQEDHLDTSLYVPTLSNQFQQAILPDMKLSSPQTTGSQEMTAPTPDYATMAKLLELWNDGHAGTSAP